ncbi:hypothetical protein TRFO_29818 [Tritrichomonas foetus]|uniref:Uncharacterized protein n=1 Tax=Tritrichomonas foetus TaxID=1144522 RepID=A0A1J4JZM3_9EUKA|nr:hypothetical protein TRFO_29818 [Tritrichomonas foetus]|eukprot:OHT02942.1 hypothetical protein TRFO_29818 [Tritrichomonas foetus]
MGFFLTLLYGIVQQPIDIINRNILTCKTPGFQPETFIGSSRLSIKYSMISKFEAFIMDKIIKYYPRLSESDNTTLVKHINDIINYKWEESEGHFMLIFNGYSANLQTSVLLAFEFDNSNGKNIQMTRHTSYSPFTSNCVSFFTIDTFHFEKDTKKIIHHKCDYSKDYSTNGIPKDVYEALAMPLFGYLYGLDLTISGTSFIQSCADILHSDLNNAFSFIEKIVEFTKEEANAAIEAYIEKGYQLSVDPINKKIREICIPPTQSPRPTIIEDDKPLWKW